MYLFLVGVLGFCLFFFLFPFSCLRKHITIHLRFIKALSRMYGFNLNECVCLSDGMHGYELSMCKERFFFVGVYSPLFLWPSISVITLMRMLCTVYDYFINFSRL